MTRTLLLGALLVCALRNLGCDVCGIFLGIQPNDRTSSFGLVYRMRYLEGRFEPPRTAVLTKHGGADDLPVPTHRTETYQALELRADIRLGQRWSLLGILPVVNNYASSNGRVDADIYGVADPTVLARWIAVNTKQKADTVRWRHRFTIGAGGKLPVGRTTMRYDEQLVDHDLQPGTGTFDGVLSLEYLVRHNGWGAGFSSIGRWNAANNEGFRAGHGVNGTLELFRVFEGGHVQWMPLVGAYAEVMAQDRLAGIDDAATGGRTFFSHMGARLWWRSFGGHVLWQHALRHDQGRDMMPDRERLVLGLTYLLRKRA